MCRGERRLLGPLGTLSAGGPIGTTGSIAARSPRGTFASRSRVTRTLTSGASGSLGTRSALGTVGPRTPRWTFPGGGGVFSILTGGGSLGARTGAGVSMFTVAARATAFGGVGHHHVRTLLGLGDEFQAFVLGIYGRRGLRCGNGEYFDALHVLFNVSSIDATNHRSTGYERGL
jgi:hypothetical protein